jgi:hypothetical protein
MPPSAGIFSAPRNSAGEDGTFLELSWFQPPPIVPPEPPKPASWTPAGIPDGSLPPPYVSSFPGEGAKMVKQQVVEVTDDQRVDMEGRCRGRLTLRERNRVQAADSKK